MLLFIITVDHNNPNYSLKHFQMKKKPHFSEIGISFFQTSFSSPSRAYILVEFFFVSAKVYRRNSACFSLGNNSNIQWNIIPLRTWEATIWVNEMLLTAKRLPGTENHFQQWIIDWHLFKFIQWFSNRQNINRIGVGPICKTRRQWRWDLGPLNVRQEVLVIIYSNQAGNEQQKFVTSREILLRAYHKKR